MQAFIAEPIIQTQFFAVILLIVLLVSLRLRSDDVSVKNIIPPSITNEMKGFAILAIIFAHIGYILATDNQFLSPFSILAGVGVDLFLFVSGFGLALSALKKQLTPMQFYLHRASKIFFPLWISLVLFLVLDWFLLAQTYPLKEIIYGFFGYFPKADAFVNINSPLWFITLILFYYLLWPFFFKQKTPFLSALLFFFAGSFVIDHSPDALQDVLHLYRVHIMAFPLGIAFAQIISSNKTQHVFKSFLSIFSKKKQWLLTIIRLLVSGAFLFGACYFAINSGVGKSPSVEQYISILIMLLFVAFFAIKPFIFNSLIFIGILSYEIYLLHWPLLYRFDVWYKIFPGSVATVLHILTFILIGYLLQYLSTRLTNVLKLAERN